MQTDAMVKAKSKGTGAPIVWHAVVHAVLAPVFLGIVSPWYVPVIACLTVFVTHWMIDRWFKPSLMPSVVGDDPKRWARKMTIFTVDQLLHICVIGLLVLVIRHLVPPAAPWPAITRAELDRNLVQICGFISAIWVGGVGRFAHIVAGRFSGRR